MENLRRGAGALRTCQQTVGDSRFRIGFMPIRKRKEIDRIQNVEKLQRVARCLTKAVVERPAARAADLIEDPVEDASALFVLVEALIQEVTQETAALRHAPAERRRDSGSRIRGRGFVFDEAHEIAGAGESASDNARIGGPIDDVVNAAWFEAAVERDGPCVHETPARSRDRLRGADRIVAHRHHVRHA